MEQASGFVSFTLVQAPSGVATAVALWESQAARRRLLIGLGSALAGALALRGGARAATGIPCEEALRTCLGRADDAYAAAVQACRFGQPDQDTFYLIFATGTHASAV